MVYAKGESGNPAGRPKGTTNKQLRSLRGCADELLEVIKEQALNGCCASQKLILDRIIPPLKPIDCPINLPDYPYDEKPVEQTRYLVKAVAAGLLSPSQCEMMIKALTDSLEIVNTQAKAEDVAAFQRLCPPLFNHAD